ncbi:MAG: N-acetyltransferase GCN5 [Alphaproteobacteria bacterium]|nr:MAG: N-acetyltransferase GCN5 [Alphaproteobacteria bacterium]
MGTIAIETRRAEPSDAHAIAEVHDAAWANAYAGIVPHRALTRMIRRRGERWWADAIRRSTFVLVIEVGRAVAGYATIGRNRVSTLPYGGEVYELYLKPEYQGIGLGERLFLAARGELARRGYKGTVVWVLADNDRAIRFYLNAGGRAVAEGAEHFDGQRLRKLAYAWD